MTVARRRRAPRRFPTRLIIDGERSTPASGERFDVINPATEEVHRRRWRRPDAEDVDRAVRSARAHVRVGRLAEDERARSAAPLL